MLHTIFTHADGLPCLVVSPGYAATLAARRARCLPNGAWRLRAVPGFYRRGR